VRILPIVVLVAVLSAFGGGLVGRQTAHDPAPRSYWIPTSRVLPGESTDLVLLTGSRWMTGTFRYKTCQQRGHGWHDCRVADRKLDPWEQR